MTFKALLGQQVAAQLQSTRVVMPDLIWHPDLPLILSNQDNASSAE